MSSFKDERWLKEHYIDKKMTATEIGDMFGKRHTNIQYYIEKYGLKREKLTKRPINMKSPELIRNRDWLHNQYVNENKSYGMIAEEFSIGKTTVSRYVKRFGLDKLKSQKTSGKREGELPKVNTKCSYCGKDKIVKGCRFAENETRFCDNSCAMKYANEHFGRYEQLRKGLFAWQKTDHGKLFMREHGARTHANQDVKETGIERKIRELLTREGVKFETQKKMYYWCVDFYLPDYDIVIEAQGDYWHAHPDIYAEPNAMQKKNMRRDKGKAAYLPKCGHTFLAFWETDINSDIEGVLSEIKTAIHLKAAIA